MEKHVHSFGDGKMKAILGGKGAGLLRGLLTKLSKEISVPKPPSLDPFDLIAWYAFKTALLVLFLWGLYKLLSTHLH